MIRNASGFLIILLAVILCVMIVIGASNPAQFTTATGTHQRKP